MSTSGMGKPLDRDYGFQAKENVNFAKKKQDESEKKGFPGGVSPFKMIAITILIGVLGYIYIAHIFYTQQLLREVNQLRISFENTRVDHTDVQLTYERMTGPSEVYNRAKAIGLVDGGPADRIITRN
ncbi:MAG: hypothetical protein JJU41_08725 [Bacteroidetes bacterium]|nr:hypothetical protein [Bacteroidota bacterium]MCH8524780.1 hypothetical protein [Balneolales bacterium]